MKRNYIYRWMLALLLVNPVMIMPMLRPVPVDWNDEDVEAQWLAREQRPAADVRVELEGRREELLEQMRQWHQRLNEAGVAGVYRPELEEEFAIEFGELNRLFLENHRALQLLPILEENQRQAAEAAQAQAPQVEQGAEQIAAEVREEAQAEERECSLCWDDLPAAQFVQLSCEGRHEFCVNCLRERVRLGFADWANDEFVNQLRCPQQGCQHAFNEADIRAIDAAQVVRFNEILTDRFVNANQNMRRCPTPDCLGIYELAQDPVGLQCPACHQDYCSHCRLPHPHGDACRNAVDGANGQDAQANEEWILENTKPCPQCFANIEKNDGCNHMTCRACRHEFCWLDLRPWNNGAGHREHHMNFRDLLERNQQLEEAAAQDLAALRARQAAHRGAPAPAAQPDAVQAEQRRQAELREAERLARVEREVRLAEEVHAILEAARLARAEQQRQEERRLAAEWIAQLEAEQQRQFEERQAERRAAEAARLAERLAREAAQPAPQPAVQEGDRLFEEIFGNQGANNAPRVRPAQPAPGANWQDRFQQDVADDEQLRRLGILEDDNEIPYVNGINIDRPNVPAAAQPAAPRQNRRGAFVQQPIRKGPSYLMIATISSIAAGAAYGCYKLYNYLTTPKGDAVNDLKTALVELHKEAIRFKNSAQTHAYKAGAFKKYYTKQVTAGSFLKLSADQAALLNARVDAFEDALSKNGAVEEEYQIFIRCIAVFVEQLNNPAAAPAPTPVATPVAATPVAETQPAPKGDDAVQVKQTRTRTRNQPAKKRVVRPRRNARKVKIA